MSPFEKVCPSGNIAQDLDINVLKDPCDYVESERDSEEFDADKE